MATEAAWKQADPTGQRVGPILEVAHAHGTAVALEELSELLPETGPRSAGEVAEWLSRHPDHGWVDAGLALSPQAAGPPSGREERRARGRAYLAEAHELVNGSLARVRGLLRFVGVTGSTAYGEPEPGDDLDFMVVTRPGSVWLFLAYTYLALRWHRARPPGSAAPPCFNYVLDEEEARRRYSTGRGFLFAREALAARVIDGGEYYRGLLGSAGWIRDELPRLYARWEGPAFPPTPAPTPAPILVRLADALVFPWLAAYLQLAGLVRNHSLARRGLTERAFRTVTRRRRLAYETLRFEELSRSYQPPEPGAM